AGELRVEIGERGDTAGGEEGVAEVLNRPLDLPFLVAAVGRARLGGEVVVPRELEEPGVEADVIALPLEDDAFQIVVQEGARHAADGREGLDVAAEKALERLIEGEAGVERPRPRQHEHEADERAAGVPDLHGAEVAPVDLALL